MREQTKMKLASTIAEWAHNGWISDQQATTLAAPFQRDRSGRQMAIRLLTLFAIYFLVMAALGIFGLLLADASLLVSGILTTALAAGLLYKGGEFASDPLRLRPYTGQVMVTTGVVAAYGALVLIYLGMGGSNSDGAMLNILLIAALFAIAVAYHFVLRWPQLIGLLMLFHGIGSGHGYLGHGGYFLDIADERWMAMVAGMSVLFGLYHERYLEGVTLRRHIGFGHLYIIFGLLYLCLSLWFLSLRPGGLTWVLVFSAASLGLIVIGAALRDSRFTGFGVVFLFIDIYTRLFEHFWDELSKGVFLLLAGALAMTAGFLFEKQGRSVQGAST